MREIYASVRVCVRVCDYGNKLTNFNYLKSLIDYITTVNGLMQQKTKRFSYNNVMIQDIIGYSNTRRNDITTILKPSKRETNDTIRHM